MGQKMEEKLCHAIQGMPYADLSYLYVFEQGYEKGSIFRPLAAERRASRVEAGRPGHLQSIKAAAQHFVRSLVLPARPTLVQCWTKCSGKHLPGAKEPFLSYPQKQLTATEVAGWTICRLFLLVSPDLVWSIPPLLWPSQVNNGAQPLQLGVCPTALKLQPWTWE